MEDRKFGYIQFRRKNQNVGQLLDAIRKKGVNEWDIYLDEQSGKNFEQVNYHLLKQIIRKGDILYIHSLDRFGRNKEEILQEWNDLTKSIEADVVVLDMPLLDTTLYRESMGTFIADLVLQILSWIAKEEREPILKSQREKTDLEFQTSVQVGRPPIFISEEFEEVYKKWKAREITAVQAMQEAGVKKTSFYKLVKALEKEENSLL